MSHQDNFIDDINYIKDGSSTNKQLRRTGSLMTKSVMKVSNQNEIIKLFGYGQSSIKESTTKQPEVFFKRVTKMQNFIEQAEKKMERINSQKINYGSMEKAVLESKKLNVLKNRLKQEKMIKMGKVRQNRQKQS